ncbi:EMBRYO SAC DEVELOPMENT ARREST 30-like [Olea europaea subsp. europaea]|uniref:O-fucosyltransferase family protein n=1 Tax=Olea europaea subsp. europaea TaxID=158383 RepID=A0A8S0PH27_OLEEU|nr:EMBRYO SAC DEVELOPMENT ARREST 30-like [Olea europaea subsp. europaea]
MKSKIKWAALGGLVLSFMSLLVHLFLAKSSADLVQYSAIKAFSEDLKHANSAGVKGAGSRKLWGKVKALEPLQPYAKPRSSFPVPNEENNGFIYAKVFGGFEKIRTSICDLVTVSRLLNATLVIPDIQESTRSKGISTKFKSFSYLYNEEQFISALASDVIIVKSLPSNLKEARKRKQYPIFKPKSSASPSFYVQEVLPKLKKAKVIGLVLSDGGCLQSVLPSSLVEYQRLRCRVAFHALRFRPEIVALGHLMVERLRGSGQPYLAYHPGLKRDTLAYHGCAELFQDVHTELIQYRRARLIKQGIINEELHVDSRTRKGNGSCPLMPEEVGLLLRAMGYPPRTRIYLAGSETFGGQRVLIPLRAMYTNLVDRTSLCSKQELVNVIGPETPLPLDSFQFTTVKTPKQLKEEWDKAGPRPRPLPPPPGRPIYQHEKEGWYGWITEKDSEPDPSPIDLREQAHRLLWDALDYIVSVEADAFFPGFDNDGSGWPDFSSLVMGNRLYEMASARTYRPNRRYLADLLNSTTDHLYHPLRNWTLSVREHLNRSTTEDGIMQEFQLSRSKSFLSHPIPECSCMTVKTAENLHPGKSSNLHVLFGGRSECPKWMVQATKTVGTQESTDDETETQEDEIDLGQDESDGSGEGDTIPSMEQDEEMDPDD